MTIAAFSSIGRIPDFWEEEAEETVALKNWLRSCIWKGRGLDHELAMEQ